MRFDDYVVMGWANGLGETREIRRSPAEGVFDWRLSMATVTGPAPFSPFDGVTRTLAVVAGGALDLTVDGVVSRLEVGGPAFEFSGGSPAHATPVGEPVLDLNLMVRGRLSGSIHPVQGRVAPGDGISFLVSLDTSMKTPYGELGLLDAVEVHRTFDCAGSGYLVRIAG
ncbi:hypothetical protein DDQ50_13990 [Amnibacterium flavum]|uniref:HutD-family protein n=2 Tax=Amnibacterium flavum TaxID=2173173 RepID=A0A2V1HUZ0_9MICO|nr:hypothetical protein DDQ50_13990 [Amnibacterium flavum]